jgi:hypothetical protein
MPTTTDRLSGLIEVLNQPDTPVSKAARDELLVYIQNRFRRIVLGLLKRRPSATRLDADDVLQKLNEYVLSHWDSFFRVKIADGPSATYRPVETGAEFLSHSTRKVSDILGQMLGRPADPRRATESPPRPREVAMPEVGDDGALWDPPSDTYNPEDLAAWTDFHAALAALPDHLRAVAREYVYGDPDLTYDDIAGFVGKKTSTVQANVLEARVILSKRLGKETAAYFFAWIDRQRSGHAV